MDIVEPDPIRNCSPLLYDLTALQLWHVFHLARTGRKSVSEALETESMFRKRLALSGPDWDSFVSCMQGIYDSCAKKSLDQAVAEATAHAVQLQRRPRQSRQAAPAGRQKRRRRFGCFSYGLHKPNVAELHFGNAVRPLSPFADPQALVRSLWELSQTIDRDAPQVERVLCGSWVNNLASFQALFPPSYVDSLRRRSPENKTHAGWWGQFITHDGKLNQRRAKILKNEGRFELPELEGECPYGQFREHIQAMLESATPE